MPAPNQIHLQPVIPVPPRYAGPRAIPQQFRKFVKWTTKFEPKKIPVADYVALFQSHANLNDYTEAERIQQLLGSLGLDATRLLARLPAAYHFADVVNHMMNYYEPQSERSSLQISFQAAQRDPKDTPREYANKLQDLASKAFPTYPLQERLRLSLQQFIHGHDRMTTRLLLTSNPNTLDAAVALLATFDASEAIQSVQRLKLQDTTDGDLLPSAKPDLTISLATPQEESSTRNQIEDMVTALSLTASDTSDPSCLELFASQLRRKFPNSNQTSKCLYCLKPGHSVPNCFQLKDFLRANGMLTQTNWSADRSRNPGRVAFNDTNRGHRSASPAFRSSGGYHRSQRSPSPYRRRDSRESRYPSRESRSRYPSRESSRSYHDSSRSRYPSRESSRSYHDSSRSRYPSRDSSRSHHQSPRPRYPSRENRPKSPHRDSSRPREKSASQPAPQPVANTAELHPNHPSLN